MSFNDIKLKYYPENCNYSHQYKNTPEGVICSGYIKTYFDVPQAIVSTLTVLSRSTKIAFELNFRLNIKCK